MTRRAHIPTPEPPQPPGTPPRPDPNVPGEVPPTPADDPTPIDDPKPGPPVKDPPPDERPNPKRYKSSGFFTFAGRADHVFGLDPRVVLRFADVAQRDGGLA